MIALADLAAPCTPLLRGECADPFALLGLQPQRAGEPAVWRGLLPGAESVELIGWQDETVIASASAVGEQGLWIALAEAKQGYRLRIRWPGADQITEDPYGYGLLLGELDLHLLAEGRHRELGRCLGAQAMTIGGVPGVRFAVWAPNARAVSVVGDWNGWDARRLPMRRRVEAGVWELFVPRLAPGARYRYSVLGADGLRAEKSDPLALATEPPPGTASIVAPPAGHVWRDAGWLAGRAGRQAAEAPIAIYEVHSGSWQREDYGRGGVPDWGALAERLVPYAAGLGFTHLELLPVTEHPFGGSWGYQPLALFAPTARHGEAAGFARFVDAAHAAGLGVILDWVPAHFPSDPHGLARFDGSALYEHEDPREGFHPDWNTLIYNLGRHEVRGFLIASALHWLEHFHVDGLRVDAVASMLYRDYSREPGEWLPNAHGGRENLEAIAFLRELNTVVAERVPGAMVIAEESTSWPGVTAPVAQGGLGFSYKWNMGWMNDTLRYLAREPVHRRYHHGDITFGLMYAHSERFVLPLSHDEVVHLKRALADKIPGDDWQRLATLRAYYGLMWAYPGKKLLFMGGEFAQWREWNHDRQLDWELTAQPAHAGVQRWLADLNRAYRTLPALHAGDAEARGFRWVVVDDAAQSVFAWLRLAEGAPPVLAVCNFTPQPREHYRVGVPCGGRWREVLNSDARDYGGSGVGNAGAVDAEAVPAHGHAQSLALRLPPLATLLLVPAP